MLDGSFTFWCDMLLLHHFIAIDTTHRAVSDAEVGEEAVNAVKKKMYVDDYLGPTRNVMLIY